MKESGGFEWGIATLPHATSEPTINIYGPSQSIFVSSPEEQLAAWLFIKFLSEPEAQAAWVRESNHLPTRASVLLLLLVLSPSSRSGRGEAEGEDYIAKNPLYEKAFGFMSLPSGIEPPVAGYDECRALIDEMLVAVMAGEDAQTQLDATVEACNQILEEAAP